MSSGRPERGSRTRPDAARLIAAVMVGTLLLVVAACGGQETPGDASQGSSESSRASEGTGATTAAGETTAREASSGEAAELARAEVGPKEETNIVAADGEEPDPARPLPRTRPRA